MANLIERQGRKAIGPYPQGVGSQPPKDRAFFVYSLVLFLCNPLSNDKTKTIKANLSKGRDAKLKGLTRKGWQPATERSFIHAQMDPETYTRI
ncbi:hypothetical protein GCM10007362_33810 [Saccharibacillus endophyticus]|uniref:Uncharacterized protein n=1 Tax=Saccharibacillus endophyticus TaxID=2060666 RepID=A0ABQ2A0Q9_9BACL|nr:hypothetical protein GCM10007362_33810 [Saccharibacillus endophyticus]